MSRHFSPTACFLLTLTVGIASTCFATSPTEVLYALQNGDILTYNIDPTTLQATRVGKSLAVSGIPEIIQVIPSPNGRFVYVTSGTDYNQTSLSVYATDASGVPQQPAIESLGPTGISQFVVHPSGRFAYMIDFTENSNNEYFYQMRLYTIDPSTGYLSETSYAHNFKPTYYCVPFVAGFYPNGSELEYVWDCGYPENSGLSQSFYQQNVDLQTGAPGPAKLLFGVFDSDLSADEVKLAPKTINDFYQSSAPPSTELKIYPLTTGPKKPLIDCTALMLSACTQAGGFIQDVSGRDLFLELPSVLEIVKIDLSNDTIVDTGYSIPESLQPYFSPDDSIIYGLDYQFQGVSHIQIYGFDAKTGAVTEGERFSVGANLWNVFPAQRD